MCSMCHAWHASVNMRTILHRHRHRDAGHWLSTVGLSQVPVIMILFVPILTVVVCGLSVAGSLCSLCRVRGFLGQLGWMGPDLWMPPAAAILLSGTHCCRDDQSPGQSPGAACKVISGCVLSLMQTPSVAVYCVPLSAIWAADAAAGGQVVVEGCLHPDARCTSLAV